MKDLGEDEDGGHGGQGGQGGQGRAEVRIK